MIDTAADRQMTHLRTFQQGARSEAAQRLMNEVSQARIVLLNDDRRAAYDSQIQTVRRVESPTTPVPQQAVPTDDIAPLAQEALFESTLPAASSLTRGKARRRRSSYLPLVAVGAAPLLCGLVLTALLFRPGRDGDSRRPELAASGFAAGEDDAAPQTPNAKDAPDAKNDSTSKSSAQTPKSPDKAHLESVASGASGAKSTSTNGNSEVEAAAPAKEIANADAVNKVFRFTNEDDTREYWRWKGQWELKSDGGRAQRHPREELRSRHLYQGNLSVDLDFSFGQAKFSNTGGCWVEIWGKRLNITSGYRRLDAKIHIHREGNEVLFVLNGKPRRVPITPEDWAKPTSIGVRWRSRASHFRRLAVRADRVLPVRP